MKTTLVCGILGAGKTTFIENLLSGADGKTVVLVNDFGSSGIDGEIFSLQGINSIELPSGCVCCTLRVDLLNTLRTIVTELRPESLYIEPSGIASPAGVLDAIAQLGIGPVSVIGIIDATEFVELYEAEMYGRFFEEQVALADVVLVNKADLAGPEKTAQAVALARRLNPAGRVVPTVDALFDGPLPAAPPFRPMLQPAPSHVLNFETVSISLPDRAGVETVAELFEGLVEDRFGAVRRAKALVNTDQGAFRFDLASRTVRCTTLSRPVEAGRLVAIGHDIREDLIRDALLP